MSFINIQTIGRIATAPRFTKGENGASSSFRFELAANSRNKDIPATYIPVTFWGVHAEKAHEHKLTIGKELYIEGKFYNKWDAKKERRYFGVNAEYVEYLRDSQKNQMVQEGDIAIATEETTTQLELNAIEPTPKPDISSIVDELMVKHNLTKEEALETLKEHTTLIEKSVAQPF